MWGHSRFYHIISVLLRYGLDQHLPENRYTRPIRWARKSLFWIKNRHPALPYGVRLRLALQELGPVWIKLGQMLSTRRDLFPPDIANELALLQDQVEPFSGVLARAEIERSLGGALETWFCDFDETALASASIAQVHTARFNDNTPFAGEDVVLKVIRPNIEKSIRSDVKLMYRLASWIPRLSSEGRRLRPVEVVQEYEKTLFDELDLRREMANAMQLRRNFENSPMLYIPKMYSDFCYKNVIVMERIYGIPVSDIDTLHARGTNMKLLAERGVQVFFTQVFRDSFFHADMHPGNIFVNPEHVDNPQYIGIDCGIVGSLNREDKRYLAENFLAFFNRDYHRVAELHVDSGWVPADTNVQEFEQAIRTVCDPIFAKPLSEISFGHVLLNLFNTARRFNMEVQPQLVLLQKTLLYIEGLGRQIYPQLDLWQTAKPFLQNWLDEQVGIKSIYRNIQDKMPYFREHFAEFPETLYHALLQQKEISQQLAHLNANLVKNRRAQKNRTFYLGVGSVVFISTLWQYTYLPKSLSAVLIVLAFLIWGYGLFKK
ncbi:ubiquinone biosynthesis regulatory protein kinase UbiB [Spirabiliibacterium falconis]|uniref:ubiquinone biosynthesis regulatory protein kinase UbiB n=1 Tax=Spirabiliibacterium falconis TaxID=572023 RepID=UPI001AADF616|nr:ubiquinone biosynthesis regulatory protein kinase UbiB [Spirabiliibacterium falconis]MBE2894846.1 ubiquinone biosynthesis regulatory protein kinase UbiB [Spirabiliibacterium falconis]